MCACPERYNHHTPKPVKINERPSALQSRYRALEADFNDHLKLFVSVKGRRPLPSLAGLAIQQCLSLGIIVCRW